MKFQKKITWLVCLFTPFEKLIKRKSGNLYNIIFQHIRKSIGCYPTHVIKIFIITWSKVTTFQPPTVNAAHVIYEIAVNCGKNVVNRGKLRGKSTNLEVVLFFRIRMCLLLCLFVAVSIFQCSIKEPSACPVLGRTWDGTGPGTGLFCPRTKPWLSFDLCFIFDLLTSTSQNFWLRGQFWK